MKTIARSGPVVDAFTPTFETAGRTTSRCQDVCFRATPLASNQTADNSRVLMIAVAALKSPPKTTGNR